MRTEGWEKDCRVNLDNTRMIVESAHEGHHPQTNNSRLMKITDVSARTNMAHCVINYTACNFGVCMHPFTNATTSRGITRTLQISPIKSTYRSNGYHDMSNTNTIPPRKVAEIANNVRPILIRLRQSTAFARIIPLKYCPANVNSLALLFLYNSD